MKRWREGLAGGSFFQKQAPKGMPAWIPTRQFQTWPREGGQSRLVDFPLVNSRDALLWMVQMHCIDMNAWYSRVDKPDRPDFVLFDLDPPEAPDGFALAVRVAHLIREALAALDLRSLREDERRRRHPRARPDRAPLELRRDLRVRRARSRRRLEAEHPGEVTTEWLKKKRSGVLVDHRQNGWGKTIASVYSVRPKPGAPVSTPLALGGADRGDPPARLHDGGRARARRRLGDLFEPVLAGGQALGPGARRPLAAIVARRPGDACRSLGDGAAG